jgi:spore germination protein
MKIGKILYLVLALIPALLSAEITGPSKAAVSSGIPGVLPLIEFPEIWAYLMNGEEKFLAASYPISDLGYFGAGINTFGKLTLLPDIKKIAFFPGRKHLVIAETGNMALIHFSLDPQFPMREVLIQDIVKASADYDGVQIDFEAIHAFDKENFITFLYRLKDLLGEKTLSVALPARTRTIDEPYDYERIGKIADRIIVMAYDEHWSGSSPGSIASLAWCSKVASYAVPKIGKDKTVMGLPFYGRSWVDTNHAKAYKHSSITQLVTDKKVDSLFREDEIPYFTYQETVNVHVFFEDAYSILSRLSLYKASSVVGISFWRLGQEDPDVWKYMKIESAIK